MENTQVKDGNKTTADQAAKTVAPLHEGAALHLNQAAKHHEEAAKSATAGKVEATGHHSAMAAGHTAQALEHSQEASKLHAKTNSPLPKQ